MPDGPDRRSDAAAATPADADAETAVTGAGSDTGAGTADGAAGTAGNGAGRTVGSGRAGDGAAGAGVGTGGAGGGIAGAADAYGGVAAESAGVAAGGTGDRSARWAGGSAAVGAGTAVVLVAGWLLPAGLAGTSTAQHWLRALGVLLAVAALVWPAAAWRRRRSWRPEPGGQYLAPVTVAVLAVATGVCAVLGLRTEAGKGFPGRATTIAAVAAVAVLVGVALVLLAARRAANSRSDAERRRGGTGLGDGADRTDGARPGDSVDPSHGADRSDGARPRDSADRSDGAGPRESAGRGDGAGPIGEARSPEGEGAGAGVGGGAGPAGDAGPGGGGGRRRWRVLVGVGAAVTLVVAGAAAGAGALAPGVGATSVVADPARTPAVPATVSRVAWSRAMPTRVHEVVAAGAGVAVRLDDGVAGVDGRTGRIRWLHRRRGAVATSVTASPDGATVLLQWKAGEYGRTQLVFLDADTGRVRFTEDGDTPLFSYSVPMTDDVWLSADDLLEPRAQIRAWSVRDARPVWRYRTPEHCVVRDFLSRDTTAHVVILAVGCRPHGVEDSIRFVAYGTGPRPLWQRRVAIPPGSAAPTVIGRIAPDGSTYGAQISAGDGSTHQVGFDPRTGRSVPYHQNPLPGGAWYELAHGAVVVHDAQGGTRRADSPGSCYVGTRGVVAAGAVGCTTVDDSFDARGTQTVHVREFSGRGRSVPIDLGGPFQRYGGSIDQVWLLVAAPGAWVAGTGAAATGAGTYRIVGLR